MGKPAENITLTSLGNPYDFIPIHPPPGRSSWPTTQVAWWPADRCGQKGASTGQ